MIRRPPTAIFLRQSDVQAVADALAASAETDGSGAAQISRAPSSSAMGLSPTTTRSFGRAGQFTGDSSSPVIHQDDFNQPEGASSPIAERVNRQDDIQEESAQEQQRPAQMQAEP